MQPLRYREDLIICQTFTDERVVELYALEPDLPPFQIQVGKSGTAYAIFPNEQAANYFDGAVPEIFFGFEIEVNVVPLGRLH